MVEDFDQFDVAVNDTTVFGRIGGEGDPVVLLHGFTWSPCPYGCAMSAGSPARPNTDTVGSTTSW